MILTQQGAPGLKSDVGPLKHTFPPGGPDTSTILPQDCWISRYNINSVIKG